MAILNTRFAQIRGAHTPQEHLFISQVEPYWQLLIAVLAEKE